jgi:hypothetical protein
MVAWYWLIVSAIGGIVIAKACEEIFDLDNILTEVISFLALVIAFIPICIYRIFFRLTIKPVLKRRWDKADLTLKKHLFGNLWFCVDKEAKYLWNKIFFVRVEKTT